MSVIAITMSTICTPCKILKLGQPYLTQIRKKCIKNEGIILIFKSLVINTLHLIIILVR